MELTLGLIVEGPCLSPILFSGVGSESMNLKLSILCEQVASCGISSLSNEFLLFQLVADFEDQMKIPYLKERVEKGRTQLIRVR